MTKFKAILVAASAAVGVIGFGSVAEAQYYYPPGHGYYYQPQQPAYVPPRIARKQAQLNERFVEKYGYVQPQPRYYGGGYYQQPRYYQPQPRYYQQPRGYYQGGAYLPQYGVPNPPNDR
jgi:hypothetical protein